ncbi:Uma2 family endonuclease [Solihabitans fulvus]|uniref:Uma2 family endonuclease n=2 Tax=Solihabitans fulvus TaxID=1892852 RepID=A0A5B2WX09_9PSEU|nr:Uma2 family endonuclease [Solihabitans fulvus]
MPTHLLTIEEYTALGEPESGYTELEEGRLLMSPSPVPDHNYASGELRDLLKQQIPDHLEIIQDIDIDLELAPSDQPGFSRRPDLVIVDKAVRQRIRREGGIIRASEVLVVIEVVSPGSRRMDYRTKHAEYADAGIQHYWIIDLDGQVSLMACRLADEFSYQDAERVTGTFTTAAPFAVSLRLDALR